MFSAQHDLELISLTKRYGETVAVNAINHHFTAGTYACLLGPSGCGKSSTLRMIAGHESVSGGTIVLSGREIAALPPAGRGQHLRPPVELVIPERAGGVAGHRQSGYPLFDLADLFQCDWPY